MKARRERLVHPWSQEQGRTTPLTRRYRWGVPGSRSWQAHERARQREQARRHRADEPEHVRSIQRRHYYREHETVLTQARSYYYRHREERLLSMAVYQQDHAAEIAQYRSMPENREHWNALRRDRYASDSAYREEVLEANRAKSAKKRRSQPGYRLREQVAQAAQDFSQQVVTLRAEGWTWAEVSELTGCARGSCSRAYNRAMKRQQESEGAS